MRTLPTKYQQLARRKVLVTTENRTKIIFKRALLANFG